MGYGHPHPLLDQADLEEYPLVVAQVAVAHGVGHEFAGSQENLVETGVGVPDQGADDGPGPLRGAGIGRERQEGRCLIHGPRLMSTRFPPNLTGSSPPHWLGTVGSDVALIRTIIDMTEAAGERRLYGEVDPRWRRRVRGVAEAAAWAVVLGGALALAGRIFRVPILAQWVPRVQVRPMQPAAAVMFVLGGLSVIFALIRPDRWARRLGLVAAVLVVLGGIWVIVANILDTHFPLWLLNSVELEDVIGGEQPARPAANVGMVLTALGLGVVSLATRSTIAHLAGQLMTVAAGVVAATVVVAFAYGEDGLRGFPLGSGRMSVSAALLAIVLATAVLGARPALGLMAPIISPWVGGIVLRRLLPFAVAAPPLAIAYLEAYSTPESQPRWFALAAVSMSALLVTALFATASAVSRSAHSLQVAEDMAERAVTAVNRDAEVVDVLLSRLSEHQAEVAGLDVAVRFRPAEGWLAGDSVMTLALEEQRLAAILIDVVGHGARPAIAASRLGDAIHHSLRTGADPAAALESSCWVLDEPQMMASAIIADVDAGTGEARITAGGCPPVLHRDSRGVHRYPANGPVLMRDSGPAWKETTLLLEPGDALLLYSDGLADPTEPDGIAIAGVEDLVDALQRCPFGDAEGIADWCMNEAVGLADGLSRDDASLIVIARPRDADSASPA